MSRAMILKGLRGSAILLTAFALMAGPSFAADVYLVAKEFTKTYGTDSVPMWGFALDADSNLATDGGETPTVPGPMITVPVGDTVLNIHVRNDLPGDSISIVIPGQTTNLSPASFTDSQGRTRVRSFTHETIPGGTGNYTWTGFRPGTYLYHSGTQPAKQVQMGLYGGVKKDFASGVAYPGVPYDSEVVLFYSEIDPALHAAVGSGAYGTAAFPSAVNYYPKFFLVNGELAAANNPASPGDNVLLRFLNAGQDSRVPTVQNLYMSVIAEDGNPYPHPKEQYSVLLPAGKTMDTVLTPTSSASITVFDRRGSGMLAFVNGGLPAKIGVFRNAVWFLDTNGNGVSDGTDTISYFGTTGDVPVTGDWTGTGTTKIGVFRNGQWYLDPNGNGVWEEGTDTVTNFGTTGDVPVVGNWTGTGPTKIGVFRNGVWFLDTNGSGVSDGTDTIAYFGMAGDVPVTGDWTGTGTTKIGVFRNGVWFLDTNGNGVSNGTDTVAYFGMTGDSPVTGTW